jgi:hypothetical protein
MIAEMVPVVDVEAIIAEIVPVEEVMIAEVAPSAATVETMGED